MFVGVEGVTINDFHDLEIRPTAKLFMIIMIELVILK